MPRHRVKMIKNTYLDKENNLVIRYKTGGSSYNADTKVESYERLSDYWQVRLEFASPKAP